MNVALTKSYGLVLWHFIEKYGLPYASKNPETGEFVRQFTFDNMFIRAAQLQGGWIVVAALLFSALFGYLVGSLNFALILSKLVYKDDVRLHGSGNAGATNMLRTYGTKAGVLTLILDGVKGAISVLAGMILMGEGGAYLAGLFCILGHIFPIYYKFRGGKGVVVAAVTILTLEPTVFVFLLALFILIVAWSKYISLGSVICAFFFPLLQNAFSQSNGFLSITVSVLIAVIIIVMHRSNIKRLMNRTENKIKFGKKKEN